MLSPAQEFHLSSCKEEVEEDLETGILLGALACQPQLRESWEGWRNPSCYMTCRVPRRDVFYMRDMFISVCFSDGHTTLSIVSDQLERYLSDHHSLPLVYVLQTKHSKRARQLHSFRLEYAQLHHNYVSFDDLEAMSPSREGTSKGSTA
jgi:hypothetical protein